MRTSRPARWAALAAVAVAMARGGAQAADGDTLTIRGTFDMDERVDPVGSDLAGVFDNGSRHTWSLTMNGTTYSHWSSTSGGIHYRFTDIHATSFDLEFSGLDAATLNQVVADHLAGGEADLQLRGGTFPSLSLWVTSPDWPEGGVSLWAGYEFGGPDSSFPTDASGYPTVGTEPLSLWVESIYLIDDRNGGYLASWDNTIEMSGTIGSPAPITASVGDASIVEGDRGNRKVNLQVALSGASEGTVTVAYRTVDGTAVAKADYSAASGTLTFQPGETARSITIPVKGDRTVEADETFTVEISSAVGATIVDAVGTATILNDD